MDFAQLAVTIWWVFFFSAVGLCVGSFLNVVIYRLPRDRALTSPAWSVCPCCNHRIRWYDNLPVLSYLRLGARCRDCRAPISCRYLIVEIGMAMIVLMLLDAFFIGHIRQGIIKTPFGMTDGLSYDWPVYLAHIILFAALFAMSAIDLEHYWVDVRFTNLATACGFVLHILWTPRHSEDWLRSGDALGFASIMAMLGVAAVIVVSLCHPYVDPEDYGMEDEAEDETSDQADFPQPLEPTGRGAGAAVLFLFVGLVASLCVAGGMGGGGVPHWIRALVPLAVFFALVIQQSWVVRSSDDEIMDVIEQESRWARGMVIGELGMLTPAILLGVGFLYWALTSDDFAARVSSLLHWEINVYGVQMLRHWQPLYGLATAAAGFVVAGALGWAIRIVFTLGFGKEAFGEGDIHLMAAAGCVVGWPVVVLGFFLTCGLALVGWVMALPFKRARAIPLGPWLSLSFLAVAIFYRTLIEWTPVDRVLQALTVMFTQNSQVVFPVG